MYWRNSKVGNIIVGSIVFEFTKYESISYMLMLC